MTQRGRRRAGGADGRPTVAELVGGGSRPPSRRQARRAARRGRPLWRRAGRRAFTGLVLVALLVATYYVGLVAYADNQVARADVLRPGGPEIVLADQQAEAQTFLVVGADDGGPDTVLLAHVAPEGAQSVAVVFPGDAFVDVPACSGPDGAPREPYGGTFASVFDDGGAGCLIRTVQMLTGLRIGHYVQLDLAEFPGIVEALGGVPLCLDAAVRDPSGAVDLPAGPSTIDGAETLPFLRWQTQRGTAETERIRRQQQFLGSVVDRALSPRTVIDPRRITAFLTRTADALTLDPDTSLRDLRALAGVLTDLGGESVPLLTAPIADPTYRPLTGGPAYVLLDDQLGRQLYRSIAEQTGLVLPRGSQNAQAAERASQAAAGSDPAACA